MYVSPFLSWPCGPVRDKWGLVRSNLIGLRPLFGALIDLGFCLVVHGVGLDVDYSDSDVCCALCLGDAF